MARATTICLLAALAWTLPQFAFAAGESESPRDIIYAPTPDAPRGQLPAEAARKSAGCMSCHTATDSENMHQSPVVILGCTDCLVAAMAWHRREIPAAWAAAIESAP